MTTSTRVRDFKKHGNDTYNADEDPLIAYEVLASGLGMASVCTQLKVSDFTVGAWRKKHPEFESAILQGLQASEEWWDKKAKENLVIEQEHQGTKTTFNTAMYVFTKKVRFKARENDPINAIIVTDKAEAADLKKLVADLHKGET